MQSVAVWAAFVLAQTSRYLVAGVRPRCVDQEMPPEPAIISGFADKRDDMIEPSCDELRAMWIYTKRQSRKADNVASNFPIYSETVPYNLWNVYPQRTRSGYGYRGYTIGRQRSRNPPIYGRLVHKAPAGSRYRNGMSHRTKAFEDISSLYGTLNHYPPSSRRLSRFRVGGGGTSPIYQVRQAGKFQHLKDLIRTERARELQEQHVADELAARANMKQVTMGEDMQDFQQQRKQFSNALRAYQLPSTKPDHGYDQPHYIANVGNPVRAWTRGGHQREYVTR